MLDHRKLANLAAGHSLMGRQLIDPALYRLGYGAEVIPGLTPFCFDRTTGVAVPTSQMMSSYLQQREQAFLAARNNAVAQQQAAAVAAAAAAYMDPASLPLHLRNGLTQREAAAALAATRGMYAAQSMPPAPMMLPAFSLYTEDKGAFKSLRNSVVTSTAERNAAAALNGVAAAGEAARYAEHLQRLREQHLQHQTTGKCNGACCTSNGSAVPGQSCACCPSQAALCARSPMGCVNKDPTSAATGKVCDFPTTGHAFLHRPTATTTSAAMTSAPTTASSELRFSVSSLCTPQTTTEPTFINSSRDKQQHSIFRSPIWNAGLPSSTSSGKTAFSVPKKKESSHKEPSSHHSKEHRSSGSIKDILKESQNGSSNAYENSKNDVSKISSHSSKHDSHKKNLEKYPASVTDEFGIRYNNHRMMEVNSNNAEAHPFQFYKNSVIASAKSTNNSVIFNGNDSLTTVTSVTPVVTTRHEGGSIPITKMPPLLEAVRPSELRGVIEHSQEQISSVRSPQGPPPLIAVSSAADYSASTIIKSPYVSSENSSTMRLPSSIYPNVSIPVPSYKHTSSEKSGLDSVTKSSSSSSSKSPKKTSSHSNSKYNGGVPMGFTNREPQQQHPLAFPKPIPAKPIPQLPTAHHFSSHYRPAQHQLSLQTHNEWIPHANPNVTVGLPQAPPATTISVTTSSNSATTAHRPAAKPQAIQREPDYADTPNVLQSLLIRSTGNAEPLSVTSATTESAPTSVITSVNSLPLYNIDYRFPIGPQMSLVNGNREAFVGVPPLSLPIAAAQHIVASNNMLFKDSKSDVPKSTDNTSHFSSKHKKRSAVASEDTGSSKKRILSSDLSNHLPRYSFQVRLKFIYCSQ